MDTMEIEEAVDLITTNTGVKMARKPQYRWNLVSDKILLTEVENLGPFEAAGRLEIHQKWVQVANNVNILLSSSVDATGVSRRFYKLVRDFKIDQNKNRYKSGIEEDFFEIHKKLTTLLARLETVEEKVKLAESKTQAEMDSTKLKAASIRDAALTTFKRVATAEDGSPEQKKKSKPQENSLINLWQEKEEKERKFREAQLEIDRKKAEEEKEEREKDRELERKRLEIQEMSLKLQKEQFEQQKEERALEMEERKLMLKLLTKQLNKCNIFLLIVQFTDY